MIAQMAVPVVTTATGTELANVRKPVLTDGALVYEAELPSESGEQYWSYNADNNNGRFPSYSGNGYLQMYGGYVQYNINVPIAGEYSIHVSGANLDPSGQKWDNIWVNNGEERFLYLPAMPGWQDVQPSTAAWDDNTWSFVFTPQTSFTLNAGVNTIRIAVHGSGGYLYYDKIALVPAEGFTPGEAIFIEIDGLPDTVTIDLKARVMDLKQRYDALSPDEKAKVTNYDKLEAALNTIDELENGPVQQPVASGNDLVYEVEVSLLNGEAYLNSTVPGFSGTGYVYIASGSVTMRINVPTAGKYRVYVSSANDNNGARCEYLSINGGANWLIATPDAAVHTWFESQPGTENWVSGVLQPLPPADGFEFNQGVNTITISANWGYALYDKIVLSPVSSGDEGGSDTESPVEKVENMISALPDKVTSDDSSNVILAYAAYQQLTQDEKAQVSNVLKLFIARARINALASDPGAAEGVLRYELEEGMLEGNTAFVQEKTVFDSYGGTGYVYLFDQKMTLDFYVPEAGNYIIYIVSGTTEDNAKCDYVSVNGGEKLLVATPAGNVGKWLESQPGTEYWENNMLKPVPPANGFALKAGKNTIEISANWGYNAYDSIIVVPISNPATGDSQDGLAMAVLLGLASISMLVYMVLRKTGSVKA